MNRTPIDVLEIEFGEDATYAPPAGADRWTAFRRTDLMPAMGVGFSGEGNAQVTHGGAPPTWAAIGGWNILTDAFLSPSTDAGVPKAPSPGFEGLASATGFTVSWDTLAAATATGLREALMVISYTLGKATGRTVFRVPPSSAIDPTVIAAQERVTLQSLLRTRDQRAGSGGTIKDDYGEAGAVEFESLAVLDRRIAECRARIAWFEQAAEGNDLPGAAWAGLTGARSLR